jgi:ubiquinone biosynthesis protein UbiJ
LNSEILSVKTLIKAKETSLNVGKEKGKLTTEEIAQKEKEIAELRARLTELENQK